jgi:hypothetical protein
MPWKITALSIGWPPGATISPVEGDREKLHRLFVYLGDRRLLLFGYGTSSGIVTLEELRARADDIRSGGLLGTLQELGPDSSVAVWIEKLQDACQELITMASDSIAAKVEPNASEVAPAVDDLRAAFALAAGQIADKYDLRAARRLYDHLGTASSAAEHSD